MIYFFNPIEQISSLYFLSTLIEINKDEKYIQINVTAENLTGSILGSLINLPNYNHLLNGEKIVNSYSISHRSFSINSYRSSKNEGIYYHINDLCPVDFGVVNLFQIQCFNSIPKSRIKVQVSNRDILVSCPDNNCVKCTSSACTQCKAGFFKNPDSLFCEPCSEKCSHCQESPDNCSFYFNYFEALYKSVFFYDYQKSGYIDPQDRRVCWRYHSFLQDKAEEGQDLVGGFFDRGGTLKINSHLCFLVVTFVYTLMEFEHEFRKTMLYGQMLGILRQTLDYLLKCYVDDQNIYVYCGVPSEDNHFWGRPEDFSGKRGCFKIPEDKKGTNFLANMSSAFSSEAFLFQSIDFKFSSVLRHKAEKLHNLARVGPYDDVYDSFPELKDVYTPSKGIEDDLFEASLWLDFSNNSLFNYMAFHSEYNTYRFDKLSHKLWSSKQTTINYLLYKMTGNLDYFRTIEDFIIDSFSHGKTPGGFLYIWGQNTDNQVLYFKPIINLCFWALILSKDPNCAVSSYFQNYAFVQMNYILGNNPRKTSYMIGYSKWFLGKVDHKASSCQSPPEACSSSNKSSEEDNPNHIVGGVVKGIFNDDTFDDSRESDMNKLRLVDNVKVPGILARLFEIFGNEDNIDSDQFPKPGTCFYNLYEYLGKYSSNVFLYEQYKKGIIDSPFDSQNQGTFAKAN